MATLGAKGLTQARLERHIIAMFQQRVQFAFEEYATVIFFGTLASASTERLRF